VALDLAHVLAEQLACPRGLVGRLLGRAMDLANRKPMRLATELLAPQQGERILDAGCGSGLAIVKLLNLACCTVTGIDRSATLVAKARRRLRHAAAIHQASIEDMPFQNEGFDAVLALNVLYFCDPEHRMIAALRRVLRPGGRLIIYVTHRRSMENWSFARKGRHRLFDERSLAASLVAGGFAPKAIEVHSSPITQSVTGLLALARR
jgi:ubiquinone/menaquinone biosynthesis C-methylase UbiE